VSINAEFVAVDPDELDELQDDPSSLEDLFGATPGPQRPRLSIDKAWHGLHYLLSGDPESTDGDVGPVVLGGTEVGEDEGYGPARFFTAAEVAQLAAALDRAGLDADVVARYDAATMTALSIYPGGWDDEARAWLLDSFRDVRTFFREAAGHNQAVVTCLT